MEIKRLIRKIKDADGNIYSPMLDEDKNLILPILSETDYTYHLYHLLVPRELILEMVKED